MIIETGNSEIIGRSKLLTLAEAKDEDVYNVLPQKDGTKGYLAFK